MSTQKSKHAFQFSAQRLAEMLPKLYMWTFTYSEAISFDEARLRWKRFVGHPLRGFTVSFPHCSGLRVFELHPGKRILDQELSHGLHIHMLVNQRLDVNIIRLKWHHFSKGPGRIHVTEVEKGKECYVAKYLGKGRSEYMRGIRVWAPVGYCDASKVSDIVVDSRWTAAYQFLAGSIHGWSMLPWVTRMRIANQFVLGDDISWILNKEMEREEPWPDTTWDEIMEGREDLDGDNAPPDIEQRG